MPGKQLGAGRTLAPSSRSGPARGHQRQTPFRSPAPKTGAPGRFFSPARPRSPASRLGSPGVGRAGAGGGEEREDRLPRPSRSRGLPPAPVSALPKPGPMASFIPPRALYKYLPSAHRVSGTGTDAAGAQREKSEAAQLSGDSHLGSGQSVVTMGCARKASGSERRNPRRLLGGSHSWTWLIFRTSRRRH